MISLLLQADCWLILPIILPLSGALVSFLRKSRPRWPGLIFSLLASLAGGSLAWKVMLHGAGRYDLGGWQPPLGISLRADGPAVLMVLMTAVTGLAISIYAGGYFRSRIAGREGDRRHVIQERFFWPLWLLLWGALNGLFLSGDIFNMYITLELVALSSVGLTALSGKPASQVAAMRYLLVSLLGSLSFLLGVGFLYKVYGTLELAAIQAVISLSPPVGVAMTMISVGLMLKTALFPFHFWLPPAHANALAPVSAILSALVIKGGWYLFFRFWQGLIPLIGDSGGLVVAALGGGAIIWGAFQAFSQQRLKMLVAYSTVAQIGYLFVVFPLLAGGGGQGAAAPYYFAISHSCAKGAMFLAAGTIFLQMGHDRIRDLDGVRQLLPKTAFAFALGGLSLIGLPPTGGFIAKYMYLSLAVGQGRWPLLLLLVMGSGLTAAYIFRAVAHILSPKMVSGSRQAIVAPGMEWSALALALVAIILGFIASLPLAVLQVTG
ncbi:MAG: oxidoreductase [Proteobacteria bacterium]|nr:oxidoreductase [Pseudomonadota bacterium]MBU1738542.1 oxidoreductase [Pseudomonadota bacterium]